MISVIKKQTWTLASAAAVSLLAIGILSATHRADAARTVSVSPQGKVTQVRQVIVKFDEPMIPFGDAAAKAPAQLHCSGGAASGAASGSAHWIDDKTWAYDFNEDLTPGMRCSVALNDGLKSTAGNALTGLREYRFETGGPFVLSVEPGYGDIEENQFFLLRLNGPATDASALQNIWCESNGLGNRIPVKSVDATARAALLKRFDLEKDRARVLTLAWQQTLPSATKMQLVYGRGVTGPSGLANDVEKRFDFDVRAPFTASFSCERENAKAPCTPLRPLRIRFSSPVPRADAARITLHGPGGNTSPAFDPGENDSEISTVEFAAPLPEHADLSIELPGGLKDASGRVLSNADLFPLKTATAPMPPLAKFSSSTFGIIERFAEPNMPAMLPVTLRHVEADLKVSGLNVGASSVTTWRGPPNTNPRRWMNMVDRFDGFSMSVSQIERDMPQTLHNGIKPVYAFGSTAKNPQIDIRSLSLLAKQPVVETLSVPQADPKSLRPFEVVGIPIAKPGFYVVEMASPALGASLLGKPQAMYVRTSVLVTNLGVHFKQGRENSIVWVTALDSGKPVPNAQVRISDCNGEQIAAAKTDAHGIATVNKPLAAAAKCSESSLEWSGFFVSARVDDPKTGPDMAFV